MDDVQVSVIDDNSPDHEKYLAQIPEFPLENGEFYVTDDGLWTGHARNFGQNHDVGKWLEFSDSDDFFVENFSDILDEWINLSYNTATYSTLQVEPKLAA